MTSVTYTIYSQINSLEEFGFIAGTPYTLTYNVYEEDGVTPLDMSGATFKWVLTPYGQSYNILEITGTIVDIGVASVTLATEDTLLLSGKFIQQPIIISFSGEEYRQGQGVILISPAVQLN